jgi:hypothetical protein
MAPRSTTRRKKAESASLRKCAPSHGTPTGNVMLSGAAAPRRCAVAAANETADATMLAP